MTKSQENPWAQPFRHRKFLWQEGLANLALEAAALAPRTAGVHGLHHAATAKCFWETGSIGEIDGLLGILTQITLW